jgi:hypothetical protein
VSGYRARWRPNPYTTPLLAIYQDGAALSSPLVTAGQMKKVFKPNSAGATTYYLVNIKKIFSGYLIKYPTGSPSQEAAIFVLANLNKVTGQE